MTGHPIPAIETPKRAGDPARLVASSEKARKILGWNPVQIALKKLYLTHGIGIRIIQMVFETLAYQQLLSAILLIFLAFCDVRFRLFIHI